MKAALPLTSLAAVGEQYPPASQKEQSPQKAHRFTHRLCHLSLQKHPPSDIFSEFFLLSNR